MTQFKPNFRFFFWVKIIPKLGVTWDFYVPRMGLLALFQHWGLSKISQVSPNYFPFFTQNRKSKFFPVRYTGNNSNNTNDSNNGNDTNIPTTPVLKEQQ